MSIYVHVCVFVGIMHPYAVCHGYYVTLIIGVYELELMKSKLVNALHRY